MSDAAEAGASTLLARPSQLESSVPSRTVRRTPAQRARHRRKCRHYFHGFSDGVRCSGGPPGLHAHDTVSKIDPVNAILKVADSWSILHRVCDETLVELHLVPEPVQHPQQNCSTMGEFIKTLGNKKMNPIDQALLEMVEDSWNALWWESDAATFVHEHCEYDADAVPLGFVAVMQNFQQQCLRTMAVDFLAKHVQDVNHCTQEEALKMINDEILEPWIHGDNISGAAPE